MSTPFIYQIYVTGAKNIAGYMKDNEPVIFSEQHINQLKQMSEAEQETFAESIKNQY